MALHFLNSIYSDRNWTLIANDNQFDKILDIMSEYFGMDNTYENKYESINKYFFNKKDSILKNSPKN